MVANTRSVRTAYVALGLLAVLRYGVLVARTFERPDEAERSPEARTIHVLMDPTSHRDAIALLGVKAAMAGESTVRVRVHDLRRLRAPDATLKELRIEIVSTGCVQPEDKALVIGPFTTSDTMALIEVLLDDAAVREAAVSEGCNRLRPVFLLGNVTMNVDTELTAEQRGLIRRAFRFPSPSNHDQVAAILSSLDDQRAVLLRESQVNPNYVEQIAEELCKLSSIACISYDYVPSRVELGIKKGHHETTKVVLVASGTDGAARTARVVGDIFVNADIIVTDTWSLGELRDALPVATFERISQVALTLGHEAHSVDLSWSAAGARLGGLPRTRFIFGYNIAQAALGIAATSSVTSGLGTCEGAVRLRLGSSPLTEPDTDRPRIWDSSCAKDLLFEVRKHAGGTP
ncbi:MAG: hypothetical protein ACFB9M_02570 [Myxococcota bacterium]